MDSTGPVSRLSRLTALLLKLQTRPYVRVGELANHFGVSKRTIYRDLRALEDAGVPIAVDERLGYSLAEGFNVPPVMFTEAEANAIIMAQMMVAKTTDASLIADLTSATDKIRSVLRGSARDKAALLEERIIIGKNWQYERTSNYLASIQQALTGFHPLGIAYQRQDGTESLRTVEPFAIYHNTSEHWVLIAWCRLRKDFRTFRVDRIQAMETLPETFAPHEMTLDEYVEIQRKKHFGEGAT